MKMKAALLVLAVSVVSTTNAVADPDPDFYVFLCFGVINVAIPASGQKTQPNAKRPLQMELYNLFVTNLSHTLRSAIFASTEQPHQAFSSDAGCCGGIH